ncbi:nuclear transcription factor Y subunit [Pycnococcus provasolii]
MEQQQQQQLGGYGVPQGQQQHGGPPQVGGGMGGPGLGMGGGAGMAPPPGSYPSQLASHHRQQLQMFWTQQMAEVENVGADPNEFKNHQLPLARIKKIMKSDEDVRMISAEAPVLFAKACEMFILELTLRSWIHSEENKRRTLQRNDIAAAVTKTDIFDFLVDIVPRDEAKEGEGAEGDAPPPARPAAPGMPGAAPPMDPMQYQAQQFAYLQSMTQGGLPNSAPPLSVADGSAGAMAGALGGLPRQDMLYPPHGARPPGMMMPPFATTGSYPGMPPMMPDGSHNMHGQPPPPM